MTFAPEEARRRFAAARVARLATTGADGVPHVVPFVFAVEGERIYWAVDQKPKRSRELRRLANIRENPRGAVLVDHYDEDWERLWWVRADGTAWVARRAEDRDAGLRALLEKYRGYRDRPPQGPVVVVEVSRWSSWSAEAEGTPRAKP